MKKVTKKTISTLAAVASVAGVVQPVAFAATTNTAVASATAAVAKVEKSKSAVDYSAAKAKVNKLPASKEKSALIAKLSAVSAKIFTSDFTVATNRINNVIKNNCVSYYYANKADITKRVNAVKLAVNKTYLKAQLDAAVAKLDTANYDVALAAVAAAETAKTQTAVDAAKAAIAKVTNTTDAAYLNGKLDKVDVAVAVASVSAVNSTSLKVVFNKAVDTTKATFSIKVDGAIVAVQAATWNSDKTEATLAKSVGKLVAGGYTVSVTGLTDAAITGTTTVDAEAVSGVEIVGSNLVQAANGQTGTVSLKITNQYGEDITKTLANADLSVTTSVSGTNGTFNHTTGLITIDPDTTGTGTFASKTITKLTLTVIHNATGKVAAKELTVAEAARVGTFTVDQPVLPTNATKFVQGTGYVLPVTANDQYGTALTYTVAGNTNATGLSFVASSTEVSNFQVNSDGAITFDIGAVTTTKNVTITVVNPATGDSKIVTFKIYAAAAADTATLTAPTTKFTTANTGSGHEYLVPISLVDQYGTKLTDDQVVAAASGLTMVSTNPGVFTVGSIVKDSKLGAVVKVSAVAKGTASLVLTVNGSAKTVTLPLTVVDPVVPVAFSVAPSVTNIAVGAASTVKASFLDNDAVAVTSAAGAYKVKYSVATADVSKVNITNNDQTVASQIATGTTITANAAAAGKSVTVTATLYNDANSDNVVDANEAVDTKTFTLNVAATDATFTYGVNDIAKLHATGAATLSSAYAKAIVVTATDASGNAVTIPQSKIVGVTSSNPGVATVGVNSGVYTVVGNNVTTPGTLSTAVITVLVQDNDGSVKTIQKTVTVSDEALAAVSIDAYLDTDTTNTTAISEYTASISDLTSGIDLTATGSDFKFVVTDQFGGTAVIAPVTYAVTGTSALTLATGDSIAVAGSTLTLTDAGTLGDSTYNASATQTLTITAATSNGLTKSVKIHQ